MADIVLVRDLMTVGVPTCPPETPVGDIVTALLKNDWEALVVLDTEGHAVGVVSRDDLVRAYAREDCRILLAEEVMTEGVPQIPPDIPLVSTIPYDETLLDFEFSGRPLLDLTPESPVQQAVTALMARIL